MPRPELPRALRVRVIGLGLGSAVDLPRRQRREAARRGRKACPFLPSALRLSRSACGGAARPCPCPWRSRPPLEGRGPAAPGMIQGGAWGGRSWGAREESGLGLGSGSRSGLALVVRFTFSDCSLPSASRLGRVTALAALCRRRQRCKWGPCRARRVTRSVWYTVARTEGGYRV